MNDYYFLEEGIPFQFDLNLASPLDQKIGSDSLIVLLFISLMSFPVLER